MATNGAGLSDQAQRERFGVLASALVDRMQVAAALGYQYGGNRDVYAALGWKKSLTFADYQAKYDRQDIAGAIVDKPADATWRDGFEITDDPDDPDVTTPFEDAWLSIEKRLRVTSWLAKVDRLAGIGEYAALYYGVRGQQPDQPLGRVGRGRNLSNALIHLTAFPQPSADIDTLDSDPASERFGLPETYSLQVEERTTAGASAATTIGFGAKTGRSVKAHWSRVLHVADPVGGSKIFGRPRLQRVYNLLEVLLLVTGSTGEAFWRGARPRFHADIDEKFAGDLKESDLVAVRDELEKWLHGLQDFIRTAGTEIKHFPASVGDPRAAAEVTIDLIAATTGMPKRILLGSERGELASSQDAVEWAHRIDERRQQYAEPVLIRPLIDRWIDAGILPEPRGGEYEVKWPDLTGPTGTQRAELAERMAKAELSHANAKLVGSAIITDNELREVLGYEPIKTLDADLGDQELNRPESDDGDPGPEGEPDGPGDDSADEDNDDEPSVAGVRVNRASLPLITRMVNAVSDESLRAATSSRVLGALLDLGQRLIRRFRQNDDLDIATRATQEFLLDYGANRVRGINDTTRAQLAESLFEGMRADETNAQLAARVRTVFREASGGRAKTIALSEVAKAGNFGTLQAMLQLGVTAKMWVTQDAPVGTEPGNVRPAHGAMNGQVVPVGEPFVAPEGQEALYPGGFDDPALSANCRCYMSVPETPGELLAAQEPEVPRRIAVHEKSMLSAVRKALREQQAAVLNELET